MRKLATALAVSIALSSGSARALSLGEIEMRSALNQPMSAEIRLSSVRADELEGMIVKLASPEAFARAGIDRTSALTDLQFTVSAATQSIIITSQRPVIEPFLNFLLEVDWPAGRMVREYTVLLDPPVFLSPNTSSRSDTAADSPAVVQRNDNSLVTPTPIQRGADSRTGLDSIEGALVGGTVGGTVGGELISLSDLDTDSIGTTADARDAARSAADSLPSTDSLNSGELVTLTEREIDSVGVAVPVEIADSAVSFNGGEVVSLTDLGAPNTDNQVALDASGLPEVQLIGGGAEAGNVVSSVNGGSNTGDGSEIVSLDDLNSRDSAGLAGSITVQRGDTLGIIAANAAGDGISTQQMMMALLAANESAFINGNINLVRAGATLRIPDSTEAARLSQAQAVASVSEQSRLWQEYRDSIRSGQRASQVAQASQSAPGTRAETGERGDLSTEAAAILETARTEVLRRDELSIVADNESTTTTASATSDESAENDAAAVGEINRRIQLAREELASSVRETADIDDQANALQSTGENLDTLVVLQQNDIAKLEAQLQAAKSEGDAASDVVGELADTAGDALADAGDVASDAVGAASDSVSNLVGGAAGNAGSAANNALASASDQLESVELVGSDAADSATNAASAAAAATASNAGSSVADAAGESKGWLDSVMSSNLKWIPIGLGGIFGVGLLGTLLLGRKKRLGNVDEAELDDVEFLDEMDGSAVASRGANTGYSHADDIDGVSEFNGEVNSASSATSGMAAGVVGAGVAGAAAAVGMGGDEEQNQSSGATASADNNDGDISELDHDDTISEVDVYLAYGLHGQAEELLTKAIDRDGDNAEYQTKLLETYAAQGNSEGYSEVASGYQQKFGTSGPEWADIAARGAELDPSNALYSGEASNASAGGFDEAPVIGGDDFLSDDREVKVASVNPEFGTTESAASDVEDESHLMDQSIDPAFAFDEADLEATGDFSQIASEIAADHGDDTASLDFPSMDKISDGAGAVTGSMKGAALGAAGAAAAGAAGIAGAVGDKTSNAMNDVSLDIPGLDSTSDVDVASAAEDLTLDLNKLSGDLELDSTELLDDSVNSDVLSITASDDTLLAGTDSLESVDEMETMMDLAKAYIDMGDNDSASSALDEIVKSGSPQQVTEAETLKRKIS